MNTNKLKIYEDINQLFIDILDKKDSGQIKALFDFLKKNPQHSPFNDVLVFAQQPDCVYYMTADQWISLHQHQIKNDAKPMVILYPFGPIRFVYSLRDTEKIHTEQNSLFKDSNVIHPFDNEDHLSWWRESKNNSITKNTFNKTIKRLFNDYQIPLVYKDAKQYLKYDTLSTAGFAHGNNVGVKEITLHPRYNTITEDNIVEAYGVLVHEIAHIFMGHLGKVTYSVKRQDVTRDIALCDDRTYLSKQVIELEAELTAWLVFNRFGINKNSVDYMGSWLTKDDYWHKIDFSQTLRISNTIFEMKN
ncbi:MAG: hypothetical protein WC851_05490 [Candidatus Shapirobacteria bacterium]|jgi:hypothetical protein